MSRGRKIIIDHSLSQRLRHLLSEHDIYSASYFGWETLENGELLRESVNAEFEVFLTADQSIRWQNDLSSYPIHIVVLSTNDWDRLKKHIGFIKDSIIEIGAEQLLEIQIP